MNYKLINRIIAAAVFLISTIVLLATVQPSVSFWDCGEFIASGYYLQVPHPPGAPFFSLLGRIFSMLPFADNPAFRVNMISVFASSFSILFLYLIAVKLIENYRGKVYRSLFDALGTFLAAAIGAFSFSFSDTFWFNGTEAEVYATSTFLLAAITYLMILWNEKADNKDNEKYILIIAYLIGLSTAVHLMSVLAMVSVVMIIMFRKYVDNEEDLKKSGYILLAHAGIVLIVALIMWGDQTATTAPSGEEYQAYDFRFKMIVVAISAVIMGIFWRKLFNRNSMYLPIIVGGISLTLTYPGIVKVLPGLMASISGGNTSTSVIIFILVLGALAYGVYYSHQNKKPTLHLVSMSFIFILLGFTTYTMIIIRSNQDPPMNENEPKEFSQLVSYLNREQYGDFPTFKRRFSTEPHQQGIYTNYSSDLDFWWTYQMNHMTTRYWLWNYAGRTSWEQDAGVSIAPFNGIGNAIIGKLTGIKFEGDVKDSMFGIPLLIGLFGIFFQFRKDWKMASVFMILFVFMGYMTAFYQNQQQPQPRERDYFYVGAFFVFSIWIAIGMRGLLDIAEQKIKNINTQNIAFGAILLFGVVFVPVRMLQVNYFTHDRSHNWVPWDYSYNLLQSCAPNSVLFTNGDNDTFPLWYLQDVEGVRRDVKIVNLSLLNTHWYIRQMKNNDPYGVGKVNIRIPDSKINETDLRPIQWEPQSVTIPPPDMTKLDQKGEMFQSLRTADSSLVKNGITFRMNNTLTFGDVKAIRVQDLMVKEIVLANNWERPIYFAVTCSEDSKIGLSEYLKMEGMAMRLVPERRVPGVEFINEDVLRKQLYNSDSGVDVNYRPGFKFTGLNNPDIFFDDNHIRMTQNYRNSFIRLALFYTNTNRKPEAVKVLDLMEQKMPRKIITLDPGLLFELGNLYINAGGIKQGQEIYKDAEAYAIESIEKNPNVDQQYYNPYRVLMSIYEQKQDWGKLADVWEKIQNIYPQDPGVKANVDKYRAMAKGDTNKKDTVSP